MSSSIANGKDISLTSISNHAIP